MIGLNRTKPILSSLLGSARERGFVGLALDGVDVSAAVAATTDMRLLDQAVEIARRAGEPLWVERLTRRACEIDPTSISRLQLASLLAVHGQHSEAQRLLDDASVAADDEHYRQACAVVYATSGRADEAMALFDILPGGLDRHRLPPTALLTAQNMIGRCSVAHTKALVARLAERQPTHLLVRSLGLRCHLFAGDMERARMLARLPDVDLERASKSSQRTFFEAIADFLEFAGWSSDLFVFLRDRIATDPTHWNLYGRAATAARVTSRDKEYAEIIAAIPASVRDSVEALAMLCNWYVEENRIEEASRALVKMRPLSAGWFLYAQFNLIMHTQDKSEVEKAFDKCITCGVSQLGPATTWGIYTYYHNCSVRRLRECLEKLNPFQSSERNNLNFSQIYMRCLIAVGEQDKAEQYHRTLPAGLANCAALRPFGLFFDASQGRHDKARKGWVDYLRTTHHRCVNAPSSYPKTVQLKYVEKRGAVLLFVTLFNGADFIDWFLAHYRALGVDHFFVTDNGSTDGSLERLCAESDVSVFSNTESFAGAGFGVLWINHLMQRFGVGHWCFHVDLDEGFVFPGCDRGRTLRDLLSYCDDHDFGVVPAIELDMYPQSLDDASADTDPFQASCYFDTDYETVRCELPPYVMIQGGLRQRLTGVAVLMQKSPLLWMASDVRYIECNHGATHLPVADVSGALLHYKFVSGMKRRVEEAIFRAEHFGGAIFYRRLNSAVTSSGWAGSLLSPFSRRYDTTGTLVACGLIEASAAWESFMQH
jgi:hypothetical protein